MQTPDLALGFLKTWPSFIRRIVIAALLQRLDGDFKNNYAGRGAGAACLWGGGGVGGGRRCTAYWGDTFVYPIRLSSTSLAASLPSLMAHTTSD